MLKDDEQLCSTIPNIDHNDVLWLLLDPGDDQEVGKIFKRLSDFESAAKELQKDSDTLADKRTIFDEVLEKYGRSYGRPRTRTSVL